MNFAGAHISQTSLIQYGITALIIGIVLFFRLRRMSKARRLRVEQLWIVPAIFTAIAAVVLWRAPPTAEDIPWLVLAAAIGAAIGWWRGKMMRITVDPVSHEVSQAASPAAFLFILAIFAFRYGARYLLLEESQDWHISLNLITDAPLLLAVAMFTVARIEMYLRAQRLLAEARAAHTTAPQTDAPGG